MFLPLTPLEFRLRATDLFGSKIGIVDGNKRFTYAEYDQQINKFTNALTSLGAGEGETSICLALFPELCEPSKAMGVVPHLPPHVDVKWTFNELTNVGASGDPTKASLEKGKKMREILVSTVVGILTDLDKNDWDYRSPEIK